MDLGLDEADPLGQHVLERDAHRVGGAVADGDSGQLGEHLVVVVLVDEGQLHRRAVSQPGAEAEGDVQPGVAGAGDHDRAAARAGCGHGGLHGYCPLPGGDGCWLRLIDVSLGDDAHRRAEPLASSAQSWPAIYSHAAGRSFSPCSRPAPTTATPSATIANAPGYGYAQRARRTGGSGRNAA